MEINKSQKTTAVLLKFFSSLMLLLNLANLLIGTKSYFGIATTFIYMLPSLIASLVVLVLLIVPCISKRLLSLPFMVLGFADLIKLCYLVMIRAHLNVGVYIAFGLKTALLFAAGFISQGCLRSKGKNWWIMLLPSALALIQTVCFKLQYRLPSYMGIGESTHFDRVMDTGEWCVALAIALLVMSQMGFALFDVQHKQSTSTQSRLVASSLMFGISLLAQIYVCVEMITENWVYDGRPVGMLYFFDYFVGMTWLMIAVAITELVLFIRYVTKAKRQELYLSDMTDFSIYAGVHHIIIGLAVIECLGACGEGLFEMLMGLLSYGISAPIVFALCIAVFIVGKAFPSKKTSFTAVAIIFAVMFTGMGVAMAFSDFTYYAMDGGLLTQKIANAFCETGGLFVYSKILNIIIIIKYASMGVGCALLTGCARPNVAKQ
ncbi:hypothetical protein [Eubacterium sp.]|uniref:hypothetical protein n=1 Tax=Eubacterium sp. TaxID=142586 RepID=UPI003F11BF94